MIIIIITNNNDNNYWLPDCSLLASDIQFSLCERSNSQTRDAEVYAASTRNKISKTHEHLQ